uniref:Clathrin light chain n=1 Tax=Gopherus agassizii TaxID=38772 RepID=A0A452GGE1_9SAUR
MADDFGFFSSSESGAPDEDPAAAFLAQQESEIAGIENDEGFGAADGGPGQAPDLGADFEDVGATVNGEVFQESNGPTDGYAAIARADRLTQEPESIRKWREEQKKRLQELDAASKVMEQEWREKAKKDLEEWNVRQSEQMEKNRVNNRYGGGWSGGASRECRAPVTQLNCVQPEEVLGAGPPRVPLKPDPQSPLPAIVTVSNSTQSPGALKCSHPWAGVQQQSGGGNLCQEMGSHPYFSERCPGCCDTLRRRCLTPEGLILSGCCEMLVSVVLWH